MKTVKVRVLVGVTSKGTWAAVGGWSQSVDDLKDATGLLDEDDPVKWWWVTAHLPIPTAEEIPTKLASAVESEAP